jgi:DNA-binding LytR/AlgR family response regulator
MKKVLIVEDNPVISAEIKSILESNNLEVAEVTNDPDTAIQMLKKLKVDMVTLDINLNKSIDGIHLGHIISTEFKVPFIYLTSYNDEATVERALSTNPSGYIVKPFREKDFMITVDLVLANSARKTKLGIIEKAPPELSPAGEKFYFIKKHNKRYKISSREICWIEAENNYSFLQTDTDQYTLSLTLKEAVDRFDTGTLLRIHKSYAVNINKIDVISSEFLVVAGKELPIGKNYRPDIKQKLTLI